MIRCSECKKIIIEDTKLMDWFKLVHFVDMLRSEGIIETETANSMQDALQSFKEFAYKQEANDE